MLGLAVGGREDDYKAAGADFHARGATFDAQLEELPALWDELGPEGGPRPGLMIGGMADVAFRRAAKYADGWTLGGGTPERFRETAEKLREAWRAEGREGEPRTMALFYFALGDRAEEDARDELRPLLLVPR